MDVWKVLYSKKVHLQMPPRKKPQSLVSGHMMKKIFADILDTFGEERSWFIRDIC